MNIVVSVGAGVFEIKAYLDVTVKKGKPADLSKLGNDCGINDFMFAAPMQKIRKDMNINTVIKIRELLIKHLNNELKGLATVAELTLTWINGSNSVVIN